MLYVHNQKEKQKTIVMLTLSSLILILRNFSMLALNVSLCVMKKISYYSPESLIITIFVMFIVSFVGRLYSFLISFI
ncbi:putative membrane protein [Wolbachia pipientis wVitA]|nr:putative membrane protein [Wolbachia pipientis wVitA]